MEKRRRSEAEPALSLWPSAQPVGGKGQQRAPAGATVSWKRRTESQESHQPADAAERREVWTRQKQSRPWNA